MAPIFATMPPNVFEKNSPFPHSRTLKRHPTPTFSRNQEKFVIVIFDVKDYFKCEYSQKRKSG
jgi:hypothetical protein